MSSLYEISVVCPKLAFKSLCEIFRAFFLQYLCDYSTAVVRTDCGYADIRLWLRLGDINCRFVTGRELWSAA